MIIVELIPPGGLGSAAPVRLLAAQVVLRRPDGTPIGVARVEGDDAHVLSHPLDPDFLLELARAGVHDPVRLSDAHAPPLPHGARRLAGPWG